MTETLFLTLMLGLLAAVLLSAATPRRRPGPTIIVETGDLGDDEATGCLPLLTLLAAVLLAALGGA